MSYEEDYKHGSVQHSVRRGEVDDFKQQQAQQRLGLKQPLTQPDVNMVGRSGDPLPSPPKPLEGLETAQGIDAQLAGGAQATSLYSMWKQGGGQHTEGSISSDSGAPSNMQDMAQPLLASNVSGPELSEARTLEAVAKVSEPAPSPIAPAPSKESSALEGAQVKGQQAVAKGKEVLSDAAAAAQPKIDSAKAQANDLAVQAQDKFDNQVKPAVQQGIAQAQDKYETQVKPAVQQGIATAQQSIATAQDKFQTQVKPAVQEKVAQAQTIANEQVIPAVQQKAAQAQTVVKEQVIPAVQEKVAQAQSTLNDTIIPTMQEKVLPAIQSGVAQVQGVYQEKVQPALASGIAQAQTVLKEQVLPAVQSGVASAQASIAQMREDGLEETYHKADVGARRRLNAVKESVPVEHRERARRLSNAAVVTAKSWYAKAAEVWAGEEPIIREYIRTARLRVREYGLEKPLLAVSILLLLWASVSFVSWMAFPHRAANEQVVVYQPDWKPSTGPVMGPDNAGTVDRLKARVSGVGSGISESIDETIESAKLRAHGIKNQVLSAMPSTDDIELKGAELKERMAGGIDDIKEAMPSQDELKARVGIQQPSTLDRVKAQAVDLKDRAASTLGMKKSRSDKLADGLNDLKEQMADSVDSLKARASELKNSAAQKVGVQQPSTMDRIKQQASDIKDTVSSSINNLQNNIPSTDDIKARAGEWKDSAAESLGVNEPSTLDRLKQKVGIQQPSTLDRIKQQAGDLKDSAQARAADLKASMEPSTMDRIKQQAGELKDSIPSTDDIKARMSNAMPSTKAPSDATLMERIQRGLERMQTSDTAQKVTDRVSHLLPEQLSQLRAKLGGLVDKLTPEQQHYAATHNDVFDADDHVIEWKDSHNHVKEGLDL